LRSAFLLCLLLAPASLREAKSGEKMTNGADELMALKGTLGLCGLVFFLLVSKSARGILRASLGAACVFVLLGIYGPLVPAFTQPGLGKLPKVFGIGLSRTGTTSMAVALRQLGYHPHHATGRLLMFNETVPGPATHAYNKQVPKVNKFWADAFDAQTDIPVSLVFEQLAHLYPDAVFILTKRKPSQWAQASMSFFSDNAWVWRASQWISFCGLIPPRDLFQMVYGDYEHFSVVDWTRFYVEYEARVREFFAKEEKSRHPRRFYELDVSSQGFEELATILKLPNAPKGPLPRIYVFNFTFFTQSIWQALDLLEWFF